MEGRWERPLDMACVLPELPENTAWADVAGSCEEPPCCEPQPAACCGAGLLLPGDATLTCVITCVGGFNQGDGGSYDYTCDAGELSEPTPICVRAFPFVVLIVFGLVCALVWTFMAYATFVQGQKLVHERRFSAPDTPATRARRKSSGRGMGGAMDKRQSGHVCAWLARPGGCCVPEQEEDTRMYSAIGTVEHRSCCQRFCANLCGCFGLAESCRAFWQWHVTQCGIYGGKFVFFQIAVNFVYGVSTSFWFFFMVYAPPSALRARAHSLPQCVKTMHD